MTTAREGPTRPTSNRSKYSVNPRFCGVRWQSDLSAKMVEGIDGFLMRELEQSVSQRQTHWHRDAASRTSYDRSVEPNREHLRRLIGAQDQRVAMTGLEYITTTDVPARVAE